MRCKLIWRLEVDLTGKERYAQLSKMIRMETVRAVMDFRVEIRAWKIRKKNSSK
ncbi:hypothetical protein [Cyclobacterium lianum]|uniref:hypothetical protein n=1 Tax=Cyclobacterium lianum TaxID=388280 RepID=UPI001C4A4804|nr:hypothetical protein [Cyclobacterium lianum]